MASSAQKLEAWRKARPGRVVGKPERVNVNAVAFSCECTEGGKLVVRGQGPTADAAVKSARDQLWRMALEASGAGPDSNGRRPR